MGESGVELVVADGLESNLIPSIKSDKNIYTRKLSNSNPENFSSGYNLRLITVGYEQRC